MRNDGSIRLTCQRFLGIGWLFFLPWLGACSGTVPSVTMERELNLPVPGDTAEVPSAERLTRRSKGERLELTPRTLILAAFDHQPDIKSSYQRFKSEEARYDFFFASRDSLTPQFKVSNAAGESRAAEHVTRDRSHTVELGVEKRFFDTTELNVAIGYETNATDEEIGNRPFVSASMRYPLWGSREKLARTSEDIFRRNELNDAQLGYIDTVRERLERALFRFHDVANQAQIVQFATRWVHDLEDLLKQIDALEGRDTATDGPRVEAEITRASAQVRNAAGWYEVQYAKLKASCGLPFHTELVLVDEPFNPFAGETHEALMQMAIETDPEIATLRNEVRNAEVQLDLARRGTWDIALLLDGQSFLEGRGEHEGESDWSVSTGLEVSHVDPRVTESLARQAQARMNRFKQAIVAREDDIFVDILEPLVRIDTLGESRDELAENLVKFREDYENGVAEYVAGRLNIDDLVKRRETVFQEEVEVSRLTFMVRINVAELCTATGKFFDLIEERGDR